MESYTIDMTIVFCVDGDFMYITPPGFPRQSEPMNEPVIERQFRNTDLQNIVRYRRDNWAPHLYGDPYRRECLLCPEQNVICGGSGCMYIWEGRDGSRNNFSVS